MDVLRIGEEVALNSGRWRLLHSWFTRQLVEGDLDGFVVLIIDLQSWYVDVARVVVGEIVSIDGIRIGHGDLIDVVLLPGILVYSLIDKFNVSICLNGGMECHVWIRSSSFLGYLSKDVVVLAISSGSL